jgi:hypothetical protein
MVWESGWKEQVDKGLGGQGVQQVAEEGTVVLQGFEVLRASRWEEERWCLYLTPRVGQEALSSDLAASVASAGLGHRVLQSRGAERPPVQLLLKAVY